MEKAQGRTSVLIASEKFRTAVGVINRVDARRLALLLPRVSRKLETKNEPVLSAQEEEQLAKVLNLALGEVRALLAACAHVLEQAAYAALTPTRLASELQAAGVAEEQAAAFRQVWAAERELLLQRLRSKSMAPLTLDSLSWQLHLLLARNDHPQPPPAPQDHLKQPSTIFSFALADADAKEKGTTQVNVEFSHGELYNFFLKLEAIQEQLDALG
jgi:hypothetical protein